MDTRLLLVLVAFAPAASGCWDEPASADAPPSERRMLRFEATPPSGDAPPATTSRPDVPEVLRVRAEDEAAIDDVVAETMTPQEVPGAVVLVGRPDGVVFQRAYGHRTLEPLRTPMRTDTIFDLASLTKPFTAIAVMQLVEQGRLNLDAPVDAYLPELAGRGITARALLTHTAGLAAVNPLSDFEGQRDGDVARTLRTPGTVPGAYRYSDLGFIALGELVARISGQPLDRYLEAHVLRPLGMHDTGFNPGASDRVAPTERAPRRGANGVVPIIHGEVNDPRAWRLGGVAGNAGLFSTAEDLGKLARALLAGGAPILRPGTLQQMTTPVDVSRANGRGRTRRGLGFDMHGWTPSSDGSFGHGGYTGTWLWIDPEAQTYLVVLTNRVHPDGEGNVHPMKQRLLPAALAAAANASEPRRSSVLLGVDVLRRDHFRQLDGMRVGLVTNDAGRARDGRRTWELLRDAPNVELAALFAPEHGMSARREGRVQDGRVDGIPLYSLFGRTREPPAGSLDGLDAVVIDLQDVGVRYYTYVSTMGRVLEAAAGRGLKVVVLDRPNPIGGERVEGPITDARYRSFVNHHPLPVRHGMTIGELAKLLVADRDVDVELHVVRMEGWARDMYWEDTGLRWVPPSPNLRTPEQTLLYPAVGLVEAANVSVGRGTDAPFELLGAPYLSEARMMRHLEALSLPGVSFAPARFQPDTATHRGYWCRGVRVEVTDRDAFEPVRTGLALAKTLARWEDFDVDRAGRLIAEQSVLDALRTTSLEELEGMWAEERAAFEARRSEHLLYR